MELFLKPFSEKMYHEYLKEYENDADLWLDKSKYEPYIYSEEKTEKYIKRLREKNMLTFAICLEDEIIGEIIFKEIIPEKSVTLGIAMKNDKFKNKGYGTFAEKLAVEYAFNELGIKKILADSLITNKRSQYVLEKVGFIETHRDDRFIYYEICADLWKNKNIKL